MYLSDEAYLAVSVPREKEKQLADGSQETVQGSQDIKGEFAAIQQYIGILESIIDYIEAISETTNLLGLNSALQADKTGELSRGFSAVAAEIRKLTQSSKDSIERINAALLDIKHNMAEISEPGDSMAMSCEEEANQFEQIAAGSSKLYVLSEGLLQLTKSLF